MLQWRELTFFVFSTIIATTTAVSSGPGLGSDSDSDPVSESLPDYVDLRLNNVDEVRVLLTDGKQGRASIDSSRSRSIEIESETYDGDGTDPPERTQDNGAATAGQSQLYYPLRNANITYIQARARSDINVHQVSCYFVGSSSDQTYPWIRASVSEHHLLNFYTRTNNDSSDNVDDNFVETREDEALVSNVYCVLEEENVLKVLVQLPLDSSASGRGTESDDIGRSILRMPIRLLPQEQFARPLERRLYRYAMHRFTFSQPRFGTFRRARRRKPNSTKVVSIKRAALLYEVGRTMICRMIEYEDGSDSRLIQGEYYEDDKDIVKSEKNGVVAIYCDDPLQPEEYVDSVMGTGWDAQWFRDGYSPYREIFEWY